MTQKTASVVTFGLGAAVYGLSFFATGFAHQNKVLAMWGLAIQLVGVVLILKDMSDRRRARGSGTRGPR
jgi:hypothetical protein